MDNIKKILDILSKIKELVLVVSAVTVAILGVILTYKLAPFVEADRNAEFRITAVETRADRLEENLEKLEVNTTETLLIVTDLNGYIRGTNQ